MNHNQQEQIKEINAFLISNSVNVKRHIEDSKAKDADIKWEASRFWAKVIHKASPLSSYYFYNDFLEFKQEYETRESITVNDNELFSKFWLRNVMGFVEIASGVESACMDFEKIKDHKEVLKFLYQFQETLPDDKKTKVDKKDFDTAIKEYEQKHNITLSEVGIYKLNWVAEKDKKIELSNINYYFKPFLDYWDEFLFINAFKKEKYKKEATNLLIEISEFEDLYHSYREIYSEIPAIGEFIAQKVISKDETHYSVNFYNNTVDYWSELCDKISGYYWELLIKDFTINTDEDRIKIFITKILYWPQSPDLLIHTASSSKKRFLDTAYKLIINEPDVDGIENEYQKVRLDIRFSHGGHLFSSDDENETEDFSLDNSDFFELLESLEKWEEKANVTYLYDQGSRNTLSFLIKTIVKHDREISREDIDEENYKIYYFKRIQLLLNNGITKPFLLWDITRFILLERHDVIPYLIIEESFASLAFKLIDEISFSPEQKNALSEELWKKSIQLLLDSLSKSKDQYSTISKILFQLYRQLNKKKYNIPYNRNNKDAEIQLQKDLFQKESEVLSLIEDCNLHNHKIHGRKSEYLLPVIFNDLVLLFTEFNTKPLYRNGTIQFPVLQWGGLIWLMKCSTYWKYKNQFNDIAPNINQLTYTFYDLYIKRIELTEIKKYNYFDKKEELGLPLWSEKIERLERLEWIYPIYFIYKQSKLNSFLEPRFFFEPTEEHYHKKNHFTADKLRTHIGVLLQVLRKLILPSIPYGFDKSELKKIKVKIEEQIIEYLKIHVKDLPKEGRIDLFDFNKEWGYNSSEKEALLPQLARAINWFNDRKEIINNIVQSNDINKILTIMEWVTSEGVRKILVEKIKQSDLRACLEESHWIPEIQNTLIQLSRHPELINQIEEVVTFWEENISGKRVDYRYKEQLYQTKLLLAYFRKNDEELEKVEMPDNKTFPGSSEFNHYSHKQFYTALIRIKKDAESSHSIFNDLLIRYPNYPILALNRMAAKINHAEITDNIEFYKEALEEWKEYAKNKSNSLFESLEPNLSTNKLTILSKLEEYKEMDIIYNKLELPYRMLPNVLETRLNSLLIQKRRDEAQLLLESAEIYHQFADQSDIQFIHDLKQKVRGIDNIEELKVHYNRIFTSRPEKLIKIFPENLNGRDELYEFITNEVALAVDKMLDKVHSLSAIRKEDKYNDLVQLALESRITPWGWKVKDQTRKAFSASSKSKDLGEIDLDIQDVNSRSFITCEAFILRDIPRVQSHLGKVMAHYSHKRSDFIILIYYLGKQSNFEKKWKEYCEQIIPNLKYPDGDELANSVIDDSKKYNCQNSAIKIACSIHKSGTKLHHLFVNINYKK